MSRIAAVSIGFLLAVQDPGPDRLFTSSGDEVRGQIVRMSPDGSLVVKTAAGSRAIALEEIRRMQFEEKPEVAAATEGERVRPRVGGTLTGSIASLDAARVSITCSHGSYAVRREDVRALEFGAPVSATAEVKEDQDLITLAPEGGKGEPQAVAGTVERLDAENVRVDGKDYPRKRLREIRFRPGKGREPSIGLFARVSLKNGDGLVGMLRAVEPGRISLFSHYAGAVGLDKAAIHSVVIVPQARVQSGNLLICEPGGVTEVDRRGVKIWSYNEEPKGFTSARKLANGNVMITSPNGRVLEVRPTGPSGGQTSTVLEGLEYPLDAVPLDNGNLLVAEAGQGRVAEFDPKDRSVKLSFTMNYPTSLERLEDGGTLVCVNQGPVVEVDAKGIVRHRYTLDGANEYRATRTAEGTILVADQRGTKVVELDRKSGTLWKFETPQPRMAVRLDDGSTLILKRNGEIVEVDPAGKARNLPGRYPGATAFSVY